MSVKRAVLALALFVTVLMNARSARAQDLKDRFNFRVSLSGMYLRETQDEADPTRKVAGPISIGYGDLRIVMDARRLPGNFELHVDGRVRLTGNYSTDQGDAGTTQIGARGYLGGREYQLTEVWARGRWSKIDFGLGRLLVPEADALRVDGVRLWVHVHKKWDLSLYGGGYVNPYSRSLDTDYVGGSPAFVGGASVRYGYDKIWGSFSGNAAYLGGKDDGGPVVFDPTTGALAAGNFQTEPLRAYATWSNFWRPIKYLDFYHDLVVDLAGAAGVQLTRLDVFVAAHLTKQLSLRLGYDHMSSIAIEMYLTRLLQSRTDFVLGSIENGLTLSRTARDEGRLSLEGQFGRTTFTAEGRLRRRVLVTPSNDPQFVYPPQTTPPNPLNTGGVGDQVAPSLGYDATLSVRNGGSYFGLRPSLWLTYLRDYRARDLFVGLGLGRDFARDRVFLDFAFTYANVRDDGAVNPYGCTLAVATVLPDALKGCFGTRVGHNYQAELSVGGTPFRHWFLFADYRAGVAVSDGLPVVITHVLLGRIEARY